MRTLNLGIVAHVDAGKTTLTERLLFTAGAIDRVGSVDAGTTQTDSLDLERERGITIRSAVASFLVGDLAVNLVDTPGHPDFIAEVERVLGVLDGAVLVVSAVEGVQPQTPLLFRALRRLNVPTLIFVNKVDRRRRGSRRRRRGDSTPPCARASSRWASSAIPATLGVSRRRRLRRRGRTGCGSPRFWPRTTSRFSRTTSATRRAFRTCDSASSSPSRRGKLWCTRSSSGRQREAPESTCCSTRIAELLPAGDDERDADAPVSGRVFKIERAPRR